MFDVFMEQDGVVVDGKNILVCIKIGKYNNICIQRMRVILRNIMIIDLLILYLLDCWGVIVVI